MKKLITEVAGIVEAPVDTVWRDLAAAMLPEGKRTPGSYTVDDFPATPPRSRSPARRWPSRAAGGTGANGA